MQSSLDVKPGRVLVTGSGGFIGQALCSALERHEFEVFNFDRSIGLDVTDRAHVDAVFRAVHPDHVIHLAGVLGTHELFDHVHKAVNVNIMGTVNILEACVLNHTAYVGVTMLPIFPSIYTATKVSCQKFATAYHHNYDLPVVHVRAFNAFGPGQKHGPGHPRKIIPAFATEGWANESIKIWGDGTQVVDLIHVDDVANVFMNALSVGDDSIIEAGTGASQTVNNVAEFVIEITGSTAGVEHLPMRRGEIPSKNVVSTGLGWDHLDKIPEFSWEKLIPTIDAYKP